MQVQVHTDNKIQGGESLAQWIQEEATSRLGRFREYITRVEVFLSDVDAGKSGANDKRCRLEARPAGRQPVTVTADADKLADAFTGAVDKLARAMSRRGFRVSTAGSAEEGLILAQQDLPDFAALDLKMDGDSGLVLLPKLLELDPEMRVVILTGYSSIATAVEAIKRGACNYLCKPADADDVLAALLSQHADLETLVPDNPMSVDRLQWEHIQRVLGEHEGNISATARALGMHRRTLQRKLQKRPVRR